MISIIIPTLNRPTSLVKLVESIHAQIFLADELEVLIVFNTAPSKKNSMAKNISPFLLGDLKNLQILFAPHPGVNNARNTGILAAKGDLLLFIDDDCLLTDRNYLKKIKQLHLQYPDMPAIGGPYLLSEQASFWDKAYHKNMDHWLQGQRLTLSSSRALLGGNASYKSFVFDLGLRFTPGIKYGGSETPLNTILFDQYGPLGFFEDVAIEHQSQMTFRSFVFKAYMQGKGYAWQNKLRPQQIQNAQDLNLEPSWAMRTALQLYSFIFMVGFRTSIHERRWALLSVVEEIAIYLRRPFIKSWRALYKDIQLARARYER